MELEVEDGVSIPVIFLVTRRFVNINVYIKYDILDLLVKGSVVKADLFCFYKLCLWGCFLENINFKIY